MQILFEKPPNYDELKELFKLDKKTTTFFSYGDCVYSPDGKAPTADLIAHEETHLEQQGNDRTAAKIWWMRYVADPAWRIEQEAEAYGAQYKFYCGRNKDKNYRFRYLNGLASHLAGPMYGKAVKHQEAIQKIKSYAQDDHLKGIEKEIE